eukprot:3521427-Pleurochrysis_carterae.AAC.1
MHIETGRNRPWRTHQTNERDAVCVAVSRNKNHEGTSSLLDRLESASRPRPTALSSSCRACHTRTPTPTPSPTETNRRAAAPRIAARKGSSCIALTRHRLTRRAVDYKKPHGRRTSCSNVSPRPLPRTADACGSPALHGASVTCRALAAACAAAPWRLARAPPPPPPHASPPQ